ncbi:MAG: hypothetical protein LBB50_03995 [Oscillospiraceae bacterium]|jgi:hypothetical protein|nr:hypothetical protein [Oscillospiraceae bacterium]
MKKALSVLLAMCMLVAVAVPFAFAGSYKGAVKADPTTIAVGESTTLSLDPNFAAGDGSADTKVVWALDAGDDARAKLEQTEGESVKLTGISAGTVRATAYEGATSTANRIDSVDVTITRNPYSDGNVVASKTEFPVGDFTELTLDPPYKGTDEDHWVYWAIEGTGTYIVAFRPGRSIDGAEEDLNPSDDHFTYNNESMFIYGSATGIVTINAYERDLTTTPPTDTPIDSVTLKIKYAEDPSRGEPTENELRTILKIWWNDLKWTWNYEIHPWLKHSYFAVVAWFESIPATVASWFQG